MIIKRYAVFFCGMPISRHITGRAAAAEFCRVRLVLANAAEDEERKGNKKRAALYESMARTVHVKHLRKVKPTGGAAV